ncbi:MAG: indolepyruvate ferredoxin oxidoreductase subunit alpha [Candidatus Cloacimonadota bacterium]|nr:MAG: indolepyruvate ferredoxin oxidoreductase subunit alpha [Candidatus Cloacimonadota bacterium]
MKVLLSGNEAVARGAYEGGCHFAAAYPGTPSTEILENIAQYKDVIYCEWSTNEKVALEVATGASFAGARSLAAMKHVGLNVAADPFFSLSYIGVTGGIIIVSADDPGMHSSQNEQDNRHYARFAKLLMLEPSDSNESKEFTRIGFDLSETFDTPVLLRMSTRLCHSKTVVELGERKEIPVKGYEKDIKKRLVLPAHARLRHIYIEERLKKLAVFAETFEFNRMEIKDKNIGIITSGISYQYAKEAVPDASFLKLSLSYPMPFKLIETFSKKVKKLYVIEENEPFIETEIKAYGIEAIGKEIIPITGELNPSIISKAFGKKTKSIIIKKMPKLPPRPPALCPGCSHTPVFYMINKLKLTVTGDIGCYTLGALPPLNAMDTCVDMGASIGNAYGMERALGEKSKKKIVAVIGDSTFFHSGITPLIDIVYNKGTSTIIILDNRITAMTGHQEHPGTGTTLMGEKTIAIKPEDIVKACGVKHVFIIDPYDLKELKNLLKREVERKEPSVIIARRACMLLLIRKKEVNEPYYVNEGTCIGCEICIGLGCPAISMKDEKATINEFFCVGCGVCAQLCPEDKAIVQEKKKSE